MDGDIPAVEHRISHRMRLADLCNALGITDAVEIGTHQGFFAREFMERFNGSIVLVDPWDTCEKGLNGLFYPYFSAETTTREADMEIAISKMAKFGSRVVFVRSTGDEALQHFRDESVGFVYIDGLHDYESVYNDIWKWWEKVSPGGVLAGHDYFEDLPDVIKAVDDFLSLCQPEMSLSITSDYPPSWWFRKPERSTR